MFVSSDAESVSYIMCEVLFAALPLCECLLANLPCSLILWQRHLFSAILAPYRRAWPAQRGNELPATKQHPQTHPGLLIQIFPACLGTAAALLLALATLPLPRQAAKRPGQKTSLPCQVGGLPLPDLLPRTHLPLF